MAATGGTLGPEADEQAVLATRPRGLRPSRAATIVVLIGLVITASVTWTAWTLNRHNEHRLLEVQTRQAAAVLSSTILALQNPLSTALQIEAATGGSTQQSCGGPTAPPGSPWRRWEPGP